MKVIINKAYKTKKGNVVILIREKSGFVTTLISKPILQEISKELLLNIIKDFRFCMTGKFRHTEIKFIDDINAENDSCITYFETCYGWDL
jgi:hypothetical protein